MMARSSLPTALILATVVGASVLWLPIPGLEIAELSTYDLRASHLADEAPPDLGIRLILVDEESRRWAEEELGREWPWPRELYGAVIELCRQAGARSLTFAVDFSEPHEVEDTDARFAESLAEGELPIVLAVYPGDPDGVHEFPTRARESPFAVDFATRRSQQAAFRDRFAIDIASLPVASLSAEASELGYATAAEEPDGVVRRFKPFYRFDEQDLPFLGLVAEALDRRETPVLIAEEKAFQVEYLDNGSSALRRRILPLDADGYMIPRYRRPQQDGGGADLYPAESFADVMEWLWTGQGTEPIDPAALAGSHVFFGLAAELRPTPVGELAAVDINALLLDNLLNDSFIRPASLVEKILLVLIPIFGAVVAIDTIRKKKLLVVALLFFVALPWVVGWLAYQNGLWTPIAAPVLGTVVSALAAGARRRVVGRRHRLAMSPVSLSEDGAFDVFLSHNSTNKPVARELCQILEERGLRVWLDEREIPPGTPWQDALEEIIRTTRAAAVLVGADGFGPWEIAEMRACLSELVERGAPVIPVLLPGAPDGVELPLFLRQLAWVDLRPERFSEAGIDRLVWGVTGEKP